MWLEGKCFFDSSVGITCFVLPFAIFMFASLAYFFCDLVFPSLARFRRQHDQLRNVIVKVLRPTVSKASGEGDDGRSEAEAVFDTADANAIEEVNLAYEHVKEVDGLDLGKQGTDAWDAAQKRCVAVYMCELPLLGVKVGQICLMMS